MRVFSLFTGVGGFEIAMPKSWKIIGFSEIDKYANQVLRYRFPKVKNYGDITTIRTKDLPDFDLLTGGSPCQDLSIAGKRRGLSGARSGLFMEYIRILCDKKPRYFIWENVKGALSSNYGFDFAVVLNEFSEAGYSLWWQVLNAKDFGVPQNRERIFVFGVRNGSPKEVFFESTTQKATPCVSTLTARYYASQRNGSYIIDPKGIKSRWLTLIECERLMSFPDNWTQWGINEKGEKVEISDSQRYKMCGNGVVSNVVREIINTLIKIK